ncbi:class I SAM-dependent methyltransferase [SAR86 cluster bacterium]|nr:class I SAM-dependent methyltransferase [SAR86 cluster bacterium]
MDNKKIDSKQLSEDDIRPYSLYNKEKEEAYEWDRNFLIQNKDKFEQVDCPACSSKNHNFSFSKKEIDYCACAECETVFVNPRPSLDILHQFYSQSKNYEYWGKHIFPASEEARKEKIFKPRANKLIEYADNLLGDYDSVLEIGAGYGTMSAELVTSQKFKRVIALELTEALAETCRERGLETLELPAEKLPDDIKVDVIASFEVIEHLYSVEEFLISCHSHLNDEGLLIVSCPNFQGFDFQILGEVYGNIDHEHLNYFNPQSLKSLIERFNFEVIDMLTPGKLDADIVRNKALKGEVDLEDNTFLKTILLDKWDESGEAFQEFLSDNMMSGHMWAVAKKIN